MLLSCIWMWVSSTARIYEEWIPINLQNEPPSVLWSSVYICLHGVMQDKALQWPKSIEWLSTEYRLLKMIQIPAPHNWRTPHSLQRDQGWSRTWNTRFWPSDISQSNLKVSLKYSLLKTHFSKLFFISACLVKLNCSRFFRKLFRPLQLNAA